MRASGGIEAARLALASVEAVVPPLTTGSARFAKLNAQRARLIERDLEDRLSAVEARVLQELELIVGEAVDREFPLPEVDLEALDRLEERLKKHHGDA